MRRNIGGLVYNKKWHFWDSIISGLKMYLYLHNAHSMWALFCTFPFSPWPVEPGNRESDESHSDPFLGLSSSHQGSSFFASLSRSFPWTPSKGKIYNDTFLETSYFIFARILQSHMHRLWDVNSVQQSSKHGGGLLSLQGQGERAAVVVEPVFVAIYFL